MKQLTFIALLLLVSIRVLAQVTPQQYMPRDYSIIPPSPEVSSLMKYNEIPVSYFSGLPQINIPIYELKQGNLSVPLSLNYHGGGIKVDEVEGEVGLGWTLMAGGCISRTVYGLPDDAYTNQGGRGLLLSTSNDNNLRNYIKKNDVAFDPGNFAAVRPILDNIVKWNADYEYGKSDMANDVFQINAMGISGTFIYNDLGNLVFSGSQRVSINPSSVYQSYPTKFIVTDAGGTKYYFDKMEFTRYDYKYGYPGLTQREDSIKYKSAWHLTKIKNIENDSILFFYHSRGYKEVYNGYSQTQYSVNSRDFIQYVADMVGASNRVYYYPERLVALQSNSVIVRFKYDENYDRIDGISIYKNDETIIYNGTGLQSEDQAARNELKRYEFGYNNFSYSDKLMLKSVSEISLKNGDANLLYTFDYHNNGLLPFKWSAQDFCGYYNGEKDNVCLVPKMKELDLHTCGANRDVSIDESLYGSLTSITYPTGGKTIFRWEPHEFGYLLDIPVKKESNTVQQINKKDTLVGLIPSNVRKLIIDNYEVRDIHRVYIDLSNYFNINQSVFGINSEFYKMHPLNPIPEGSTLREDIYPRVVFIKKGNNTIPDKMVDIYYIDKKTMDRREIPVSLEPGTYRIELRDPIKVDGSEDGISGFFVYDNMDYGKVHLRRSHVSASSSSQRKDYWGGLRIQSIMSVANAEGDTIVKDYIYCHDLDPGTSDGVIGSYPFYKSYYFMTIPHPVVSGILCTHIDAISSYGLYKTPVGGQRVEYKTVLERYSGVNRNIPSSLQNIMVEYNYSSQNTYDYSDYNNNIFRDMQPRGAQMWTSKAHYRGNLVNKKIRNLGGIVQSETNYTYNIFESENLSTFTTDLFRIGDFSHLSQGYAPGYANLYSIGQYQLIPYNKTTKSEESIEYSNGSQYKNTVSYTYFYNGFTDYKDYALVRSKIIKNSIGEIREIFYTYKVLNRDECLNLPETEITVMNGTILSAKRMEYYPENYKLKSVYTFDKRGISASGYALGSSKETSPSLKTLINIPEYSYRYDGESNLVEIRYNGEVLASFLWGYRGLYPIAEIKNLPYDELADGIHALGFSSESLVSSTAMQEPQFSNFLRDLRTKFSGYDVTTMTYHWLIGVSTATDSRGITTHFTFDDFGRLKDVKDYNGYFIRKYDYHYAGQE